jgi:Ca2+-binding EF-hand superfamily protein
MIRFFYIWLIRLHPPQFRQRFGDEMLWIFDQSAGSRSGGSLLVDALLSLLRQWTLRPEFRRGSVVAGVSGPALDAVPAFYTVDTSIPRLGTLVNGGIVSLAVFGALSFAIGEGGAARTLPVEIAGSHHLTDSRLFVMRKPANASDSDLPPAALSKQPAMRGIESKSDSGNRVWSKMLSLFNMSVFAPPPPQPARSGTRAGGQLAESAAGSGRIARILVAPGQKRQYAEDSSQDGVMRGLAAVYFENILVLGALDVDHDLVISASEIADSPKALKTLDKNRDGTLSPEECGLFDLGDTGKHGRVRPEEILDPEFLKLVRLRFMRLNPVLAALDADHNGQISAAEIQNSPAALKTLDKDDDGRLVADELLPDSVTNQSRILMRSGNNVQ